MYINPNFLIHNSKIANISKRGFVCLFTESLPLPETKETRQYINLKNNKKYKVMTEIDNRDATEYVDVDSELYVTFDTKLPIPLIGNVAAGIPISVQVEFDQYITILLHLL